MTDELQDFEARLAALEREVAALRETVATLSNRDVPLLKGTVRDALDELEAVGATVQEVSVPMHLDGLPIWNAVVMEETTALVCDEGVGHHGMGFYDTQFADAFDKARRAYADDYLATLKLTLVLGQYLADEYRGHYYAKAMSLRRKLAVAYDDALADVDVFALPTMAQTAHEVRDDSSRLEVIDRALNMFVNTAPFGVSGHPAISVPAGIADGLPVGLMFVGEQFDDDVVLDADDAYEPTVDWESE